VGGPPTKLKVFSEHILSAGTWIDLYAVQRRLSSEWVHRETASITPNVKLQGLIPQGGEIQGTAGPGYKKKKNTPGPADTF